MSQLRGAYPSSAGYDNPNDTPAAAAVRRRLQLDPNLTVLEMPGGSRPGMYFHSVPLDRYEPFIRQCADRMRVLHVNGGSKGKEVWVDTRDCPFLNAGDTGDMDKEELQNAIANINRKLPLHNYYVLWIRTLRVAEVLSVPVVRDVDVTDDARAKFYYAPIQARYGAQPEEKVWPCVDNTGHIDLGLAGGLQLYYVNLFHWDNVKDQLAREARPVLRQAMTIMDMPWYAALRGRETLMQHGLLGRMLDLMFPQGLDMSNTDADAQRRRALRTTPNLMGDDGNSADDKAEARRKYRLKTLLEDLFNESPVGWHTRHTWAPLWEDMAAAQYPAAGTTGTPTLTAFDEKKLSEEVKGVVEAFIKGLATASTGAEKAKECVRILKEEKRAVLESLAGVAAGRITMSDKLRWGRVPAAGKDGVDHVDALQWQSLRDNDPSSGDKRSEVLRNFVQKGMAAIFEAAGTTKTDAAIVTDAIALVTQWIMDIATMTRGYQALVNSDRVARAKDPSDSSKLGAAYTGKPADAGIPGGRRLEKRRIQRTSIERPMEYRVPIAGPLERWDTWRSVPNDKYLLLPSALMHFPEQEREAVERAYAKLREYQDREARQRLAHLIRRNDAWSHQLRHNDVKSGGFQDVLDKEQLEMAQDLSKIILEQVYLCEEVEERYPDITSNKELEERAKKDPYLQRPLPSATSKAAIPANDQCVIIYDREGKPHFVARAAYEYGWAPRKGSSSLGRSRFEAGEGEDVARFYGKLRAAHDAQRKKQRNAIDTLLNLKGSSKRQAKEGVDA